MIDERDWSDVSPSEATTITVAMATASGIEVAGDVTRRVQWAKLPFYDSWRLVRIRSQVDPGVGEDRIFDDVYLLWRDGEEPRILDGTSAPIHDVNEDDPLWLEVATAPDYIRFFFWFLRVDGDAFVLFEDAPKPSAPRLSDARRTPHRSPTKVMTSADGCSSRSQSSIWVPRS